MHKLNDFSREQAISDQALAKQFYNHLLFCTPLLLTVPLLYCWSFNAWGLGSVQFRPFFLGGLGWTLALLLRAPMMLLIVRFTHNVKEQVVAALLCFVVVVVCLLVVL